MGLHIICERDVGLFSLIQQVVANIPWALAEERTPVVRFGDRVCYWTPNGYADRTTVWEYYFEPVIPDCPAAAIPSHLLEIISERHPSPFEVGYDAGDGAFVSAHFGDHPDLAGKTLWIPYELEDPSDALRTQARDIIRRFVRTRAYINERVARFFAEHLQGEQLIGVHVRGTDAVSEKEVRPHRQGSLRLSTYLAEIERLLNAWPSAKVFVATDAKSSLSWLRDRLGARVIAHDSLLHEEGEAAGEGPTGWIVPAYIAGDRDLAARNGEEAVIEYLLLSRCHHLVHNGSSLARMVLLNVPEMPHTNTHLQSRRAQAEPVRRFPVHRMRMRARRTDAGLSTVPDEDAGPAAVAPELVARVKAEKARRQESAVQYVDHPRVAFIVHSFSRVSNIEQIHRGLTALGNHELIVCDDGSVDGSREEWASLLQRPNDFLILSNDLHEIRILDRAIRFTPADIVCLVQDDDQIPTEGEWLDDALARFDAVPDLAIIGGFMGFRTVDKFAKGDKLWGPAPFEFVQHVNIGPYFIRRRAYEMLGGWDYSFSQAGEPGICFDNELCLRAWMDGYKVGYRFVPFKGPPGHYALDGGTVLFSGTTRRLNMRRNQRAILERYSEHMERIDQLVTEANATINTSTGRKAERESQLTRTKKRTDHLTTSDSNRRLREAKKG